MLQLPTGGGGGHTAGRHVPPDGLALPSCHASPKASGALTTLPRKQVELTK